MSLIIGTDKLTLLGNQYKNTSTALTGWTTAITAGDVLRFDIDKATISGTASVIVKMRKT